MSKTTILIDQSDAAGQPLNGYVLVQLSKPVVDSANNKTYLPAIARAELVSGVGTLTLENSATSKQSYTFQIYQYGLAQSSTLIWQFTATVPASLTPIAWSDLITQVGIAEDNNDASLQAVIRKLYYDDSFWVKLQQTFYPRRGNYSPLATYTFGSVVYYQGNLYSSVSQVPIAGQDPISFPSLWQIFSEKGATGAGTTGDDAAYNATAWDGVITAPSKNAVRDVIETLETKAVVATKVSASSPILTTPSLASSPLASDNSSLIPSTNWVRNLILPTQKAVIPIGTPMYWVTMSAPQYWVFYDGRVLSTTTYAELYAVLGTLYNLGGEAAGTFRVPDFRGRVPVGLDLMNGVGGAAGVIPSLTALGFKGGAATHTLTTAEMPAHTHNMFSTTNVNLATGAAGTGVPFGTTPTSSTGGGGAHNNLQPYIGLPVIGFANV
jgi:microcystin-dependent protein